MGHDEQLEVEIALDGRVVADALLRPRTTDDLRVAELVARLQLALGRADGKLWIRAAPREVAELLALMGWDTGGPPAG